MLKNKIQIVLTVIFLGLLGWWFSYQSMVATQGLSPQWFSGTYGVLAFIGAIIGFIAAKKWGGLKSVLGKALTFFALGLLAQEAGQLIYQYYIYVQKIDIPYPSYGDIAYFGSVLLYITAAYYLLKASGVKYSLKGTGSKVIAILVPVVMVTVSFFVLLHGHQYDTSQPITVFLDFGYPMGQAVYISLAITAFLLSRKMLGGILKTGMELIIIALVAQYVADFSFIYESSRDAYVTGAWVDLLYMISYFLMASALLSFIRIYKKLGQK